MGSTDVVISEPTTFRITASNGWLKSIFVVPDFLCTAVAGKSVEIITPPTVFLWAEPAEVLIGEYTTIKWSSNNADTVFIKGIESSQLQVQQAGAWQVKIDKTKTFKIMSSNRAGTETRTLTVRPRIAEPPEPSPSPSPSPQPGDSPPQSPQPTQRKPLTCSEADTGHFGFTNTKRETVFTVTVYYREGEDLGRIITVPPGQTQYVYDFPAGRHNYLVTYRGQVPIVTFPPGAPTTLQDVIYLRGEIYVEQCKSGVLEIK